MKRTLKHLTVGKFKLFLIIAIFVNAGIIYLTQQQKSYWIGSTITSQKTELVRTTQFKENMSIRTTDYQPGSVQQYGQSLDYSYNFTVLDHGHVVMHNEEMPVKTGYHRYFFLDEECALVFRSPKRQIVNNTSILCLYH